MNQRSVFVASHLALLHDDLLFVLRHSYSLSLSCPLSLSPVSHRNVMMRLNLQLTMGTFSLSLFGLMGVAFGMNLESSFEEVSSDLQPRAPPPFIIMTSLLLDICPP